MYSILTHELTKAAIEIEKALNGNKTPEREEISLDLLKAIREYKRREFDRIYVIYN